MRALLSKRLVLMALAAFAGVVGLTATPVQAADAAAIEIRVWQDVEDERSIQVSARHDAGSWATLGTRPLALDDGSSRNGRYRYGDTSLDVSLPARSAPLTIELRVWQHRTNSALIYVSARPEEGDWARAGTNRLRLDGGHSAGGRYRYGDLQLEVSLPPVIPEVRIEFSDDFTPEQRIRYEAEIRREFASVARFFANRHQLAVPGLTVRLTRDVPPSYDPVNRIIRLMQWRLEGETVSVRAGEGGTVGIMEPEWTFLPPLGHEYVHALQVMVNAEALDRAGRELPSAGLPDWMSEGMAWYLDALHEQAREMPEYDGAVDLDDADWLKAAAFRHQHWTKSREYLLWIARESTTSLRDMEFGAWHEGIGYLALERLVARSSEAALFDFFREIATAPSWQVAFEDVFGLTAEDFYADFAAWRSEAAPPPSWYSGVVLGPDGEPVSGVRVIAMRSVLGSVLHGPHAKISWAGVSQEDGSYRMTAEPGLAVLVIGTDGWSMNCSRIAFLAEDGGLTRDPEEARRFVIELEGVAGIEVRLPKAPSDLCRPEEASWLPNWAIGWPEGQWRRPEDYASQFLPWTP